MQKLNNVLLARPVAKIALIVFAALLCVLYVGIGLSPSSYGCFLHQIGAVNQGLIAGHCQSMRSDEYWVLTPYFQISVRNGFDLINHLSPYKENLHSFFALPTLDWGLIFRPQVWLFHIMPPAQAYSAYWLIMMLSFWGSMYKLLRFSGVTPLIAILGSFLIFFSQYIQLWWTMNAGVFAFIGWIGVAMLADLRPIQRFIAVAVSSLVTMFALLYPPFLIAGGLAILIFCVAVRPRNFSDWSFIVATLGGLFLALSIVAFYHWELIKILSDTVYPGSRRSSGGGLNVIQFLGQFFPYLTTVGTDGNPVLKSINKIEISVIGSWLPLMLVVFAERNSLGKLLQQNRFAFGMLSIGLVVMCLWIFTSVLNFLPSYFLLGFVPPRRMIYGVGLLVLLFGVFFGSKMRLCFSLFRLGIFIFIALLMWILSSAINSFEQGFDIEFLSVVLKDPYDLFVIPIAILGFYIYIKIEQKNKNSTFIVLLMVCVVSSVLTFGRFNPLQKTSVIFDKPVSPLVTALDQLEKTHKNDFLAIEGRYGAGLVGLGYPTLNHVLIYPQLDFFRKLYPHMGEDRFNHIFNRYGHIYMDGAISEPYNKHLDVINIPLDDIGGYRLSYGLPCSGKLPNDFNPERYLELNLDVKNAGVDPGEHYLKFGCPGKRNYGSVFLIK